MTGFDTLWKFDGYWTEVSTGLTGFAGHANTLGEEETARLFEQYYEGLVQANAILTGGRQRKGTPAHKTEKPLPAWYVISCCIFLGFVNTGYI